MATQVISFAADDGTIFATEAEADQHNVTVKCAASVETYIAASGAQKAQAGLLRKHLPLYTNFLNTGALPTPEPKKEKKAKAVVEPVPVAVEAQPIEAATETPDEGPGHEESSDDAPRKRRR